MPDFGDIGGQVIAQDKYCVDIVMCIDATYSMEPILDEVKGNALKFCEKFHVAMNLSGKNVEELRIKVLPFRDFKYDGDGSIAESRFFSLPEEQGDLEAYVKEIYPSGGGDEPENAYEAIAVAMNSDWTRAGTKRRHVILMFTDATALPLQEPERVVNPTYPANMPKDFQELGEMWAGVADQSLGGMPEEKAKRLVIFAPNADCWNKFEGWNLVWPSYSRAGEGLKDVDIDMAIALLVASMNDSK